MLSLALLPLLAVGAIAQAQNATYIAGAVQALNANNLTSLVTILGSINSTTEGQALLAALPNQTLTIFAPNNEAFSAVPSSVSSDVDLLASIISYHVVPGNFTGKVATTPNHTIVRTLLNNATLVDLEGNKTQVLVWDKAANGTGQILDQTSNVTVLGSATYQNLIILVIDGVLSPPGNVTTALSDNSLSGLAGVVNSVPGLADVVAANKGLTLFAPSNDAITAATPALSSLAGNNSAITTVIQNHVINGTSYYSSDINTSLNLTSAAGEAITFSSNSSGLFVSTGNGVATAKIIQTDLIIDNGVIHIIDGVLANTASNSAAASSAYASATSIAAKTSTSTSSSSTSSAGSKSAAMSLSSGLNGAVAVGLALSVFGMLVGGLTVL